MSNKMKINEASIITAAFTATPTHNGLFVKCYTCHLSLSVFLWSSMFNTHIRFYNQVRDAERDILPLKGAIISLLFYLHEGFTVLAAV